ncbi:MAG: hypothetical protein IIV28_01880 [Alistipes sp.]|nr:hypothetical protein [Alistipes sp.]
MLKLKTMIMGALALALVGCNTPKEPTYAPLPATWLNQARWEDEGIKREEPKRNKADDDFLTFLAESGVEV